MRRTIISTVCMAVVLVLAASCSKKEDDPVVPKGTVITAVTETVGTGTKADMAYCYEVIWRKNDQIYVTDGTKDDTFTLSGGFDTNKGQFTEDGTKGISGNIEAFYPASLKTDEGYVWPAVQINNPVAPMYANQAITGEEGETVNFSSLGAVLQIVLTNSEKSIGLSKIKLYDGDKPMSGEFTVENGKAVITSTDKSGITVNIDDVTIGYAAKYFNIAVPAGKYEDLHLEFTFSDGRTRKMVSTTMPEIQLNTVAKIALYLDIALMPKSISLNYNKLDLIPGDEYKLLKATILPENAANKNVIWSSSDENIATVDQTGKITALALGDCTITATAADSWLSSSCKLTVQELPSGAIPGKFSVSDTKKVYFSKGNLYYGTWAYYRRQKEAFYLEPYQWGRQPIRDSVWRTDHKSHFYWSKIDVIAKWQDYPKNESHETTSDVFFTNETLNTPHPDFSVIINDVERKGEWRTLSTEEWEYLFRKRKMTYDKPRCTNWFWAIRLLGGGEIYRGIFIYPDDYNGQVLEIGRKEDWEKTISWQYIHDAGIVFLLATGIREGNKVSRSSADYNPIGCYWSSDCNDTNQKNAHSLYFQEFTNPDIPDSGIYTEDTSYRGTARTVRLVRDIRE